MFRFKKYITEIAIPHKEGEIHPSNLIPEISDSDHFAHLHNSIVKLFHIMKQAPHVPRHDHFEMGIKMMQLHKTVQHHLTNLQYKLADDIAYHGTDKSESPQSRSKLVIGFATLHKNLERLAHGYNHSMEQGIPDMHKLVHTTEHPEGTHVMLDPKEFKEEMQMYRKVWENPHKHVRTDSESALGKKINSSTDQELERMIGQHVQKAQKVLDIFKSPQQD